MGAGTPESDRGDGATGAADVPPAAPVGSAETGYHMPADEFRRHGHALVDWVADYLSGVEQRPIRPAVEPGSVRAGLPASAPEAPEPFESVLRDLDAVVMPGITHWQHPGWFAYFPANTSGPSVLGELVAAGLGVQGMLWSTSPAVTEVESLVLDWLVQLMGLPESWRMDTGPGGGVLQASASDAVHTALVVARHGAVRAGHDIRRLVVYTSSQAHSSVEKGARVAGFEHFRTLQVDDRLAMDADAFRASVERDVAEGLVPCAVVSTVGTTGTNAVDPVRLIGAVAREQGLWHHVDAAYAGAAMVCPELRHHQDGLELVDSYTFNAHKWMFTNFDCSAFWVADRRRLVETLSVLPPYLRDAASESGEVVDYRDWHVPLGRRFRALKLMFVLRSYGAEGIRHHLRAHMHLAGELADRISGSPRLTLVAPVPFALVCFRHTDGDAPTAAVVEAVNRTGRFLVTPSVLPDGTSYVRVSIGQTGTEQRHVDGLWQAISAAR
ncbi:MAG TPA: pyridoxal-dependent decarboxylase [Nocardioidaceae bacterium]|nr:pyridoxal-dependent decarboxylase [Nocardioidaceae bacterium]